MLLHRSSLPVRTFHQLPLVVRESDWAILATGPRISHSKFVYEVLLANWSSVSVTGGKYERVKYKKWGFSCWPPSPKITNSSH
jgi:hypothetical protein